MHQASLHYVVMKKLQYLEFKRIFLRSFPYNTIKTIQFKISSQTNQLDILNYDYSKMYYWFFFICLQPLIIYCVDCKPHLTEYLF